MIALSTFIYSFVTPFDLPWSAWQAWATAIHLRPYVAHLAFPLVALSLLPLPSASGIQTPSRSRQPIYLTSLTHLHVFTLFLRRVTRLVQCQFPAPAPDSQLPAPEAPTWGREIQSPCSSPFVT